MTHTRPNLDFAISKLRQKSAKPTEIDDKALYRLLRYVNGTINTNLIFGTSHKDIISEGLVGYVDTSYTDYTNRYILTEPKSMHTRQKLACFYT